MKRSPLWVICAGLASGTLLANLTLAKGPTAAEALRFKPIQEEVEYDIPAAASIPKCTIENESIGKLRGFVVTDENRQTLRRFLDTDGDNSIDQWCYFRDGLEVYRDIDSDGNGKADQYRWLGTAGTRWGIDRDENNKIDSWQQISAEEVTEEIVAALRTKDLARFKRVLLTTEELASLDLTETRRVELTGKLADAVKEFSELATKQKVVTTNTKWVSFGGGKPGAIAGTKGSVVVYDNAAAVVETEKKHAQVPIGTLVLIEDGWRAIDLPRGLFDESGATPVAGYFFQAPLASVDDSGTPGSRAVNPALQKLIADLEKIDKDLAAATDKAKLAKLNGVRADVIEQIVKLAEGEDLDTWIRQYAETISAAAQTGDFPEGVERLKGMWSRLTKDSGQEELVVFVGFRALQADYNQSLGSAKENEIPKIHSAWMEGLERLVTQYANTQQAAEPMLALAQEYEIADKEETSIDWYAKIIKNHADTDFGKKANGAKRRLESIGNRWMIAGPTLDGKGQLNPAALAGKVVVVQYWASWCDACKQDFATLKTLQAKYGKQGFQVVGVNLDTEREDALKITKATSLPWPNLFEPGGFDSRFSNEMGLFTLPVMILIDKQGKVVSRNITAGELDVELKKLLK